MYDGAAVIWDITNRIQRKSTAHDEPDTKEQGLLTATEIVVHLAWNVSNENFDR